MWPYVADCGRCSPPSRILADEPENGRRKRCHDLIHVDLPWNPARLEQRNGRIDRKLQPSPEVWCRYFVYEQRPEDIVLQALVRKTERIRDQLGSAGQVISARLSEKLERAKPREIRRPLGARGLRRRRPDGDRAAFRPSRRSLSFFPRLILPEKWWHSRPAGRQRKLAPDHPLVTTPFGCFLGTQCPSAFTAGGSILERRLLQPNDNSVLFPMVIPYPAGGVQISTWPCQRLPSLRAELRMIVAIEDEFERPRRSSSGSALRAADQPRR